MLEAMPGPDGPYKELLDEEHLEFISNIPSHRMQQLCVYFLWEAELLDLDFERRIVERYLKTVTSVKGHQVEQLVEAMKVGVLDEEDVNAAISGAIDEPDEDGGTRGLKDA